MVVILLLHRAIMFLNLLVNNTSTLKVFFSIFYKLLWRLVPSILQFTYTVSTDKFLIAFRPFILSDWHIIAPNFEEDVRTLFQPKPNQIVIDVGAHIGFYTLIACRLIEPNGRVISIEPDESNLIVLKKNVAVNKFKNVVVLPVALGCTTNRKKFYAGVMPTGSSFYPTNARALYKVRAVKEIKTVTLDSLLEEVQIRDVDWIKIDVENMDLDVLRGGKFFLKNSKKAKIILEASSYKTLEYLKSFGFEIRHINSSYYFASKN